ncbi:hypothetical protein X770_30760 [Mesorhizobium sp. LSJC269B00]|nr:hypothetical protein X770_30760 [Mesorhizobium sp. LSJC269B00]
MVAGLKSGMTAGFTSESAPVRADHRHRDILDEDWHG